MKDSELHEHNLFRLRTLTDYEVAENDPDVRDWPLIDENGNEFGNIEELIVDPKLMKVRYLDVKIDEAHAGESFGKNMLIPVGLAVIHEDEDKVEVPEISRELLLRAPRYGEPGAKINRNYELEIRRHFEPGTTQAPAQTTEFYSHRHFEEDRFYRNRR
ncbi:MAG: PRC-barrel domain-containing protein [Bacteroidia bacterium]